MLIVSFRELVVDWLLISTLGAVASSASECRHDVNLK